MTIARRALSRFVETRAAPQDGIYPEKFPTSRSRRGIWPRGNSPLDIKRFNIEKRRERGQKEPPGARERARTCVNRE